MSVKELMNLKNMYPTFNSKQHAIDEDEGEEEQPPKLQVKHKSVPQPKSPKTSAKQKMDQAK